MSSSSDLRLREVIKLLRVLDYCRKYMRVGQLDRYISIITAQEVKPSRFFIWFFRPLRSLLDLLTIDNFSWMD